MSFVFKFNRIIVSNTSKYNLLEGIDLKNFCHENNIYFQNLNEIKKGYVSHTLDLLFQVRAYMLIYQTYVLMMIVGGERRLGYGFRGLFTFLLFFH